MIYSKYILIAIASVAMVSPMSAIQIASNIGPEQAQVASIPIVPLTVGQLLNQVENPRTRAILTDLVKCESSGNPNALNPLDLDGTPSYGCLQFKDTTLYHFAKEFDILPEIELAEIHNVIYDPQIQIAVAEKMIEKYGHQRSFWQQQWPACSLKYNYWENTT